MHEMGSRRFGRLLQAAAVAAAASLLVGVVVGWRLLGRVERTADDAAQVSIAALDAVDASLAAADVLLAGVRSTVVSAADALNAVVEGAEEVNSAVGAAAELASTTAPAIASARDTLRSLQGVGRTIDATLDALSRLPLAPGYDPDAGFGATVAQLVDDLEPLPAALRASADELEGLAVASADLEEDLAVVGDALERIAAGLEEGDDLLADYREAATDARALATDAAGGLGVDLVIGRIVLMLGGVSLAVLQVLPFRRGRELAGA